MSSLSSTGRSWHVKAIVLGLLGLGLSWLVVSHSFAAYLAQSAPQAALRLRPTESRALLRLADATLSAELNRTGSVPADVAGTKPSSLERPYRVDDRLRAWADFARRALQTSQSASTKSVASPASSAAIDPKAAAQIRTWARRALASDPLNAQALRILGQLAQGDSTAKLMQAAARRSVRESIAIYWLMLKGVETQDYAAGMHYADVLLRTRSNVLPLVLPTLAVAAEHRDASGALKTLLAADPPWRSRFLAALPQNVSDPRTPLELLLAVKDTPAPPTTNELRSYVNYLIKHKLYQVAYYTWLQFLPPEELRGAGFLFNGSFELPPSGLPFDWVFHASSGVTIDITGRADRNDQHALFLDFGDGRITFRGVTQMLMLPAGQYRLTGKYRGAIRGRRGLVWRVACPGRRAPLGTSSMALGVVPSWKEFDVSFTVPAEGCPAQQLRLALDARSASESLVSGSIWYDELQISRADTN